MARTRTKVGLNPDTTMLVDTATGELHELPSAAQETARIDEFNAGMLTSRSWREGYDAISAGGKRIVVALGICGLIAGAALLGGYTSKLTAQQRSDTELAMAMRTAIPVVNALEIAIDPGKYRGKLVDVIMSPTRGGVFKSGKGLYLQESEGGMSLTVFESAFEQFKQAWELREAGDIAPYLIGKIIKARGTIQSVPNSRDGSVRTSMVVYAPGLIQILPELKR